MATKKAQRKVKTAKSKDKRREFEKALKSDGGAMSVLKLYVAGTTPRSARAVANIKRICEEHLKGRYRLEIIDVYQQPELAAKAQLVVAPTLIRRLPPPLRTFIGDLSETEKILIGLDIQPKHKA